MRRPTQRTDIQTERDVQAQWVYTSAPESAGLFDRLIQNEFLPPDEQRHRSNEVLRAMLQFAQDQVPYYRKSFGSRGIDARDIAGVDDLPEIPTLTRDLVRDRYPQFKPDRLPPGDLHWGHSISSGSTGEAVRVEQSVTSRTMFDLFKQREYRWFRIDPRGSMAWIRVPEDIPPMSDGCRIAPGETLELERWPAVGRFFETGPFLGFSKSNSVERQAQWLEDQQPNYFLSGATTQEHLALAFAQREPLRSLQGFVTISEDLTAGMRRRIESTFEAPIHRNYGLNEIGLVASRCPEGGRFHVHAEHSLVEIVDTDGLPCAPGEVGRVLVTSLDNRVMPLIRYDSGDLAVASSGPCDCGRTLPSFAQLVGRAAHICTLPPGTLELVAGLRAALDTAPPEISGALRQYQLHQSANQDYELRLLSVGPLPDAFRVRMHSAWSAAPKATGHKLCIVDVEEIPRAPNGKFYSFTSEFFSTADSGGQ